jgi:hypothetical protein
VLQSQPKDGLVTAELVLGILGPDWERKRKQDNRCQRPRIAYKLIGGF